MSASHLAYPCKACGRMPEEGEARSGRKVLHLLECRNGRCSLQPVAIADTRDEALARWNGFNRTERPLF